MSVQLKMTYTLVVDHLAPWNVPDNLIKYADDKPYVKMAGSNPSVVRLVYAVTNTRGKSLAASPGLAELKSIRNDAQHEAFAKAAGAPGADEAAFFGERDTKNCPNMSPTARQQLKESPDAIGLAIPTG